MLHEIQFSNSKLIKIWVQIGNKVGIKKITGSSKVTNIIIKHNYIIFKNDNPPQTTIKIGINIVWGLEHLNNLGLLIKPIFSICKTIQNLFNWL